MFQIIILKNEKKVFNLPVDYEPSAVAVSQDASFVAVGGALDNKVKLHWIEWHSIVLW